MEPIQAKISFSKNQVPCHIPVGKNIASNKATVCYKHVLYHNIQKPSRVSWWLRIAIKLNSFKSFSYFSLKTSLALNTFKKFAGHI